MLLTKFALNKIHGLSRENGQLPFEHFAEDTDCFELLLLSLAVSRKIVKRKWIFILVFIWDICVEICLSMKVWTWVSTSIFGSCDSAYFRILRNVRILGKKRLLTLWWHSMKFYKSDLIQYRETGFQENKLLFCVYLFLILIQKNRFSKSMIHSGIHVIRRNWKNIIGLICTFNQFATPINCVINCRWCTHHYHQFVLSAIILVQNGLTGCSHFPYQSELWGCALILSSQYFVGTWTRLSLWRTPRNISGVLWRWCGKPKRIKKYGQNTRCHYCWPNNKLWK